MLLLQNGSIKVWNLNFLPLPWCLMPVQLISFLHRLSDNFTSKFFWWHISNSFSATKLFVCFWNITIWLNPNIDGNCCLRRKESMKKKKQWKVEALCSLVFSDLLHLWLIHLQLRLTRKVSESMFLKLLILFVKCHNGRH